MRGVFGGPLFARTNTRPTHPQSKMVAAKAKAAEDGKKKKADMVDKQKRYMEVRVGLDWAAVCVGFESGAFGGVGTFHTHSERKEARRCLLALRHSLAHLA